jgi:hypothetical protein
LGDLRVADISPIVDAALDRILPRFTRDAADLVASAVGALAAEALLVGPEGRSVNARTEARSLLSDARRSAARMGATHH